MTTSDRWMTLARVFLGIDGGHCTVVVAATDGWAAWAQSLVSAVVGGVLGFAAAVWVENRRDASSFAYGRRLLMHELETIARRSREVETKTGEILLNAALPTSAWRLLLSSGQLFKLGKSVQSVVDFYGRVEEANFLSAQTLSALTTAKLVPREEDRQLFLEKATQLSREPFLGLADRADELVASLRTG